MLCLHTKDVSSVSYGVLTDLWTTLEEGSRLWTTVGSVIGWRKPALNLAATPAKAPVGGNSACGRPRARRELTPGTTTEPPAAHQDPGIGPHSAAEPLPALPAENPTGRQPSRCSAALTV